MNIRKQNFLSLVVLLLLAGSCVLPQAGTSTATSSGYDPAKDQTTYIVVPYGSVALPGKWQKTHYNSVSMQQFFKKDSVEIAIAFGVYNKYPFNTSGKLTGYSFVNGFYEWDSDYFVKQYGLKRSVLEKDSVNNYMIYRIYGETGQGNYDTYFLVGERKGNVSNFSITITDKWTEPQKIEFLKNVFSKNKKAKRRR